MDDSKRKLSASEKRLVRKMAREGKRTAEIQKVLGLTGHEAYCSDDYCIAFSKGCDDANIHY